MSEQLREALQGLVDLRGHGSWSKKWDEAWDTAYAALSTHHAAPGAPEQANALMDELEASGDESIAVLRFDRQRDANAMPTVVSCDWLPDGEYPVFLGAAHRQALDTGAWWKRGYDFGVRVSRAAATAPASLSLACGHSNRSDCALFGRGADPVGSPFDKLIEAHKLVAPSEATAPAGGVTEDMREFLGKLVRLEWTRWAAEQPNPKPSWLKPWNELDEPDKEVDRRIGEAIWRFSFARDAALATQGAEPVEWQKAILSEDEDGRTIIGWTNVTKVEYGHLRIPKRALYTSPPPTAEVEKKAARYDWLRTNYAPPPYAVGWDTMDDAIASGGAAMDQAIDAALSKGSANGLE